MARGTVLESRSRHDRSRRRSGTLPAPLVLAWLAACGAPTSPDAGARASTGTEETATVTNPDETAAPAATSPGAAEGPAPDALPVTLRAPDSRSPVDAPLEIVVEVRNDTDAEAAILLWNTPFEPTLSADAFAVARDGATVPYRGRMLRRALPPPEDAIARLAPGEALERTVALSEHYGLDAPGTYEIRFAPRPVLVDDGRGPRRLSPLVPADPEPVVVVRY